MALPLIYNLRNLAVRKLSSALTLTVVAVVVLVLAVLLAYVAGIKATLRAAGWPQNVLLLRPGATAESTSIIPTDDAARVVQAPGIALGRSGEPLISNEVCVQAMFERVGETGHPANVAVRGVDDVSFQVHPEIQIREGRAFRQGAMECIVGKTARDHFAGLGVGRDVVMGRSENRTFQVVGVFESGGSSLESEVLAPRTMVMDAFNRHFISSIVVRLTDAGRVPEAVQYIRGPAVDLDARPETKYYADLAAKTVEIIQLTNILVAIMAIGAAFAVANTMYAAVDGRRREIAMLETIGFSKRAIITAFLTEAVLLCLMGAAIGLGIAFLFNGYREDFLSDMTWTVHAFEMRFTPSVVAISLSVAVAVGLLGALAPALKASRIRLIDALRKA